MSGLRQRKRRDFLCLSKNLSELQKKPYPTTALASHPDGKPMFPRDLHNTGLFFGDKTSKEQYAGLSQ